VDGNLWKEQRRFLHDRLRHFGMKHIGSGKEQMDTRIMVSNRMKCHVNWYCELCS